MGSEGDDRLLALRILDREKAKIRAKPVVDLASPLLKEVVDKGCSIYALCLEITQRTDLHKPALDLYRHVLKMTDAVQVLIENSCDNSVDPLSRSALEAVLSLEYLFQKDYKHRSLVWRYYRLRKDLQQYDPEKQDDDVRERWNELEPREKAVLNKIHERLKSDEYKGIHHRCEDYNLRQPWYHWVLDGAKRGPADFRKLAEELGMLLLYKTVWKPYSREAHGDSHAYTEDLRHPENMQDCTVRTALFMERSMELMIGKFMPERIPSFNKWRYGIKERRDQLGGLKVDFDSPNVDHFS